MTNLTGRCACGQVKWSCAEPVLWAGHCHCDSCRRASSAPFTSFFGVRRDAVAWTGRIVRRVSSPSVRRGFCPDCGTQVYFQSKTWSEETHLYAATLDDPAQYEPNAHFHWSEHVPWLKMSDDLPKYAGTADDGDPL